MNTDLYVEAIQRAAEAKATGDIDAWLKWDRERSRLLRERQDQAWAQQLKKSSGGRKPSPNV